MNQKKSGPTWRPEGESRMTPSLARKMLAALAASELSVAAFCRLHDVPPQRVWYWRKQLGETGSSQASPVAPKPIPTSKFAPVIAKPSLQSEEQQMPTSLMQTLEATLPGGSRVAVYGQWDAMSMRSWLEAIEGGRC